MLKEAIILAGEPGTSLHDTIPDLPKCMASINGEPFLTYIVRHLLSKGIERFIFSLGYKHGVIESFLEERFATVNYKIVIEDESLGTGAAIRSACEQATDEDVLIVNGNTLYKIDPAALYTFHKDHNADCTLALKPMKDFENYGAVDLHSDGSIKNFKQKQHYKDGLINGGVYILNVSRFIDENFPQKFSFEKDYLEKFYSTKSIYGFIQDNFFIEIDTPEKYNRAQTELAYPKLNLKKVDKSWTLFLDRDGVINHEKFEEYILHKGEFRFYDGVIEALQILRPLFENIIIITNQRGVGKGLMTDKDLFEIHAHMNKDIEAAGAKIDKIYFCISTEKINFNRKPNPGMALQAKADDASIDLSKTMMLGNKLTDMLFGRNAGIHTVFIATTNPEIAFPHPDIDLRFNSLIEFAKAL